MYITDNFEDIVHNIKISDYKWKKWDGLGIVKLITCPLIKLQFYLG